MLLIFLDFNEPAEGGADSAVEAAVVVVASDLDSFHNLLVTPTVSNDPLPCLSIGAKTPASTMGIPCKSNTFCGVVQLISIP